MYGEKGGLLFTIFLIVAVNHFLLSVLRSECEGAMVSISYKSHSLSLIIRSTFGWYRKCNMGPDKLINCLHIDNSQNLGNKTAIKTGGGEQRGQLLHLQERQQAEV